MLSRTRTLGSRCTPLAISPGLSAYRDRPSPLLERPEGAPRATDSRNLLTSVSACPERMRTSAVREEVTQLMSEASLAHPTLIYHPLSATIRGFSSGQGDAGPLVVILPWMNARPKHVQKYVEMYQLKGYDVIHVCDGIQPADFLWPTRTFSHTATLCRKLRSEEFANRPLIFHSFSVGTYMLAVLFQQISADPSAHSDITGRILGFINDSITIGGTAKMSHGVAASVTDSPLVQSLIEGSLWSYFKLTRPWTVRLYDLFIEAFHDYPVPAAPALYFYSHDDPMCDPPSIERCIKHQRDRGYEVYVTQWGASGHAQHYLHHPTEYGEALTQFLRRLHPGNPKLAKSKL